MKTANPSDHIDIETQSQILDLFIAGHMDLATIAAMNSITFTQLIDFLESPKIVERLDAIQRLCERRAAIMAAEARCVALARLRSIAEHQPEAGFTPPKLFTRELETTRKAAAQLLRISSPEEARPEGRAPVRPTPPPRTRVPKPSLPVPPHQNAQVPQSRMAPPSHNHHPPIRRPELNHAASPLDANVDRPSSPIIHAPPQQRALRNPTAPSPEHGEWWSRDPAHSSPMKNPGLAPGVGECA